jgi:hypothetical protein
MRLTQVSGQTFVGIDLLGQELGPAPLPLALPVFWSGKLFLRRLWVPFDLELSDRHVFFPLIEVVHATTTPDW